MQLANASSPAGRSDLADVLERITDGFFALDSQWRLAYMNSEARALLQCTDPQAVGKLWLEVFPRARGTAFQLEYERAMREQKAAAFVEYSTTVGRWFEVKAYPSPEGVSVYFRDVTKQRRAEAELEQRARQQAAILDFGQLALSGYATEELGRDAIEMLTVHLGVPIAELHVYE
ncbi:MAG: PAS domain-containing protein, partial [Candidatus Eremiobacteraeota bacterium]|nr:PAS domain-containing protein [Candidatus Eremiobacteraeota bacterium]